MSYIHVSVIHSCHVTMSAIHIHGDSFMLRPNQLAWVTWRAGDVPAATTPTIGLANLGRWSTWVQQPACLLVLWSPVRSPFGFVQYTTSGELPIFFWCSRRRSRSMSSEISGLRSRLRAQQDEISNLRAALEDREDTDPEDSDEDMVEVTCESEAQRVLEQGGEKMRRARRHAVALDRATRSMAAVTQLDLAPHLQSDIALAERDRAIAELRGWLTHEAQLMARVQQSLARLLPPSAPVSRTVCAARL